MNDTTWRSLPVKGEKYNPEINTLMRQSTAGQMGLCGYRVKLRGHPEYLEPVSEPMVFGSCQHYMISQDLLEEDTLKLIATMDSWVEGILVTEYDWSLDQVPNPQDFFSELASAFTQWQTIVKPTLGDIIAIEEELFMPLGPGSDGDVWHGDVWLKGTPDAVSRDIIIDWKTSGRAWKLTKAHAAIQVDAYMALVKQNYDLSIRDWLFWIYDRKKREWTVIPTKRKVKEIDAALVRLLDYGHAVQSGILQAKPTTDTFGEVRRGWYCSPKFCGAWNVCPMKYINDSVDEKVIATRSW
jgi:hypothetical protein